MPSLPTTTTTINTALLSATLQARQKGYIDIISKQNPLWFWLKKKNQYKSQNGGTRLEWDLEYGQDDSEPSYQGYDVLPVQAQDNVTVASADWKQYFKRIAINGKERRINSGDGKIFDLLSQKEKNAINSLQQQFNTHFYLDGTGNGAKWVTGLAAFIASNPATGTLYGIDRSVITNWRNETVRGYGASPAADAIYLTNTSNSYNTSIPAMRVGMELLRQLCGRLKVGGPANQYPDLVLCTEAYYNYYSSLSYDKQRYTNKSVADVGFDNLTFHNSTLIADQDCPTDASGYAQAYFINSAFVTLYYHPEANLTVTPMLESADGDWWVSKVLWMGELTCSNCAKQGVHFGIQDRTYAA